MDQRWAFARDLDPHSKDAMQCLAHPVEQRSAAKRRTSEIKVVRRYHDPRVRRRRRRERGGAVGGIASKAEMVHVPVNEDAELVEKIGQVTAPVAPPARSRATKP